MDDTVKPQSQSEDIEHIKDILQGVLKAKKILNMYPPNNPIYIKTFTDIYSKIKHFLEIKTMLSLQIHQNEILCNKEQVYYVTDKEDNLALFFFKDGIREISFYKGMSESEFEDFIKIINTDFENVAREDDIVTLLWERDFDHIKYIVAEEFLYDEADEKSFETAKNNTYSDDNLSRAYHDGLETTEKQVITPVPLDETDLKHISDDIEKAMSEPKVDKLITILFELLYQTQEESHFIEVVGFIENLIGYCIKGGDFNRANSILHSTKIFLEDESTGTENKKLVRKIYTTINGFLFIQQIGKILDSDIITDNKAFLDFIKHFDKTSIPHLIKLLGELQHIKGRRLLIDTLSIVGRLDIKTLGAGLNDSKWYVVRNIVVILANIADSWSKELLIKALSHPEEKVRKEAIKGITSIGGSDILPHLKTALNDDIPSIRITSLRALGNLGTEPAKKMLLSELSKKDFLTKDFNEKKESYAALSRWKDQEVKTFLMKSLKKTSFWNKTKNDETRAFAAFALGVIGDKDALPVLEKTKKSKNKLLKTLSLAAIRHLTD
jgi:hypothetical protein